MALSSAQVWEVRTTGSDLNGGAFKAGAAGTDYSQQDGAQVVFTDLTITATATQISSSANPFTSAHVGNVLNVTSGTGFTSGRYEITAVVGGIATLDRAPGAANSVGGSGRLGGALASLGTLASAMVAGNKAWVKGGTYAVSATITLAQSVSPAYNLAPSQILGYATARGDITEVSANQSSRPNLACNAALGGPIMSITGSGWHLRNLILSLSSGSYTQGIVTSANSGLFHNLLISGFGSAGLFLNGPTSAAVFCEITAGASSTNGIIVTQSSACERCYVHDTPGVGISHSGTGDITACVIDTVTGATSDGIQITGAHARALHNVVHNAARHGINLSTPNWNNRVRGNILANNGGYGFTNTSGGGLPASPEWDGNAFYSNTSGPRNNLADIGLVNPVNASGSYANAYDVLLTSGNDPFTDSANADFSLNNMASRGALLRGTAPANRWPGLSSVGYRNFGVIQHQDFGTTNVSFLEG